MSHHSTVLIIGGGVIGSAIALKMTKEGIDTTILEKGALLSEASTASAGMICPQAVMFDSEAPFDVMRETQAIYRKWIEELENISHIPVQYVNKGMIRSVFEESETERIKKIISSTDGSVTWLNPKEVNEMEPDINPNNLGGLLFPEDGQLHPIYLAKSLQVALQRTECQIKQWLPALNLITEKNQVVGARTSEGDFYADYTIVAAGAWSSALLSQKDVHLPVFPVKGQMLAVHSRRVSIEKTVQGPDGMVIPRLDGTLTVGTTHEKAGFDKIHHLSGISRIHQSAMKLIPKLTDAEFLKAWSGLRPGTPDGLPYIGKVGGIDGLMVAAGHYGIGILLAPITAKIIDQMIKGEEPCVDMKPFEPERFHKQNTVKNGDLTN